MEKKTCTKCNEEQDILCFSKSKTCKGGIKTVCKSCNKKYWQENKNKFLELKKEYRKKNKDAITKQSKEYNDSHKEIFKITHALYRKNNREKCSAYGKKYKELDPEKWKKYGLEYREKNKEKIAARQKKYLQNPEVKIKSNMATQRYRTIKRSLPSTMTCGQWEYIRLHFNNRCAYCGKESPLEQEHFLACSKGGEHTINNIIPACKSCNSSKREKDFFEWYPRYKHYNKKREDKILKYLNYNNKCQQLTLAF
jgi:hypothetical protein